MQSICIYPLGVTPACRFAWEQLARAGLFVVDHPRPELTHIMLDAPSFLPSGKLRGGGDLEAILTMVPEDITVIGGKLNHPALDGYRKIDLLRSEEYLAKNASITADCALRLAAPLLSCTFHDCPTVIFGWGRIGKCLGRLLKAMGTPITVAARKEEDLGLLRALGYQAVGYPEVQALLPETRLLFNTVPCRIQDWDVPESCIQIDLASEPGLLGDQVLYARGLPGLHAPESAGRLMADTILKKLEACT